MRHLLQAAASPCQSLIRCSNHRHPELLIPGTTPALPCPALPSSLEEPGLRLQPTPGTMRPAVSIALAFVALLVLADSARSEPGEPTLMQKLEQFKENVKVFADNIGEKTKAALQELHDSEFSTKTRNWFSEHFKKVKEKLKDTFA